MRRQREKGLATCCLITTNLVPLQNRLQKVKCSESNCRLGEYANLNCDLPHL